MAGQSLPTGALYSHVYNVAVAGTLALEALVQGVANATFGANSSYATPFIQSARGEVNLGLPPSSVMAFLQANPELPSIVLGDFQSQYANPCALLTLTEAAL